MYNARIKKLALVFACLGLLLLSGVFYRMIMQGPKLTTTPFLQQAEIDRVRALAAEGIISPENGETRIDHDRLVARTGKTFAAFVENRRRFLSFEGDDLVIDPAGFTVSNARLVQGAMLAKRGRILDRNGAVLAETVQAEGKRFVRRYPLGPAAMPLLGVAHTVYGLKGLEKQLDPWLTGRAETGFWPGLYRFFSGREKTVDVVLTLDAAVQQAAFQALDGRTGAVVVLDGRTGEILAAAASPAFDPATPTGPEWERAAAQGYQGPLINRAMQRRYPPGSTFKLVTAAAWIEQEDFDPKWGLECTGKHPKYGISDYHGKKHGWVGVKSALALSCNVFFCETGVRLGPALLQTAERFGFNRQWFPAGQGGDVLARSLAFSGDKRVAGGGDWRASDFRANPRLVAQGAMGQNVVRATPLGMAMVAGVFANQGVLTQPRLVKEAGFAAADAKDGAGWVNLWPDEKREEGRVCAEDTATAMLALMAAVMDKGTGYKIPKIYLADGEYRAGGVLPRGARNLLVGKTGTAETGDGGEDHAWFVGVAPLDEPRYAVAALVEHGGLGAKVAGPVAVKAVLAALNR